jgi:acyl-coenzyme A thioesterase PaaI-like protein
MAEQSFQDCHFPDAGCFGCGPKNSAGLQIKSFPRADGSVVARWTPHPAHSNGMGAVCGGILSTVLDCHAGAAAGYALSKRAGVSVWGVTKEFSIQFLRPTPIEPLELEARVVDLRTRSVEVEATARFEGQSCAQFHGIFVLPREDEAA